MCKRTAIYLNNCYDPDGDGELSRVAANFLAQGCEGFTFVYLGYTDTSMVSDLDVPKMIRPTSRVRSSTESSREQPKSSPMISHARRAHRCSADRLTHPDTRPLTRPNSRSAAAWPPDSHSAVTVDDAADKPCLPTPI